MAPYWVRRVVLGPLVPVLTVLLLTSLPLAAIGAAFVSRWLPGRWRALRLLWFVLVYLAVESLALIAMFGLWVTSGFGRRMAHDRWQAAHYALMRWYLDTLVRTAQRRFHLRFDVDVDDAREEEADAEPEAVDAGTVVPQEDEVRRAYSPAAEDAASTPPQPVAERRPLLVLARHAGPGDSFLLVHALLQLRYRPRIVLRGALRWAPTVDVALHRVPSSFLVPGAPSGTGTRAIGELAAGMEANDALVIFPEGRNFTPARRTHSIAKLEELGEHQAAEDARELRHVLTPRTGGTIAALDAAPHADVVFVAHTGLEDLSGLVDLWRGVPMDAAIRVKVWRVPSEHVPGAREARAAWLAWWWRCIDAWLIEHGGQRAVPDAVAAAVDDELPDGPDGRR